MTDTTVIPLDPVQPDLVQADRDQPATTIHLVAKAGLDDLSRALQPAQRAALEGQGFKGEPGTRAIIPEGDGWAVLAGVADPAALTPWCLAKLGETLPAGTYRLAGDAEPGAALLGWAIGQYRFMRYLSEPKFEAPRVLLTRDVAGIAPALAEAAATALVRDLVNTPAEDMGPAELEAQAEALARNCGGSLRVTRDEALEQAFPMVARVGRAAAPSHAPRMIEMEWGDPANPRVAVVGKGVCFDSGGLDIKPSSGMLLMKKDMGGAAHALALAQLITRAKLPVRLHLLVPAVENAIAGNAFRPGDVLRSRQGLSVEIGNTDAEGRLILADALTRAGEDAPELIIDFATLTGAARAALGPDLPALFTRRDETASALLAAGLAVDDPAWRLPLHDGYREWLKSDIADLNNTHTTGFAGASVAALFLDRFVAEGVDWAHFDTFAWRPTAKPGRPKGGDALGLRAAWRMLQERYGD